MGDAARVMLSSLLLARWYLLRGAWGQLCGVLPALAETINPTVSSVQLCQARNTLNEWTVQSGSAACLQHAYTGESKGACFCIGVGMLYVLVLFMLWSQWWRKWGWSVIGVGWVGCIVQVHWFQLHAVFVMQWQSTRVRPRFCAQLTHCGHTCRIAHRVIVHQPSTSHSSCQ